MRRLGAGLLLSLVVGAGSARGASDVWAGYLDYAYVYSSAEPDALKRRLEEYGGEAGETLQELLATRWATPSAAAEPDEVVSRRKAIAYLLDYLARGDLASLEASVAAVHELEGALHRPENRYWYHYVLAHRALEKGRRFDFVGEVLDLWLHVVVPLEASFESLQALSLDESPNSGLASALPYLYENVARLVLLRAPRLGLDRDLDPLGAIVLMLHDGRVGTHPEVIPVGASSREYLDRIVQRLEGPESDGGSLTFTLALFEATRRHEQARALLAKEGLSQATLDAMRVASGAYVTALERADTVQGRCAVHTRMLRQLGELYVARQRLGVDPELEAPFGLEDAIGVYEAMAAARDGGWEELGWGKAGRPAFVASMRGLWEEIQEATLNVADYYLARSLESPALADDHARNAARLHARYLGLFATHATAEGSEAVPDSAYFAAHEAAKGMGDAYLVYASHPTAAEVDLAIRRYRVALGIFPFDRALWSSLAAGLEHQGRVGDYLSVARPVAEGVTRSRVLDTWITGGEPEAARIAALRRAFSDSQALLYLGFAEAGQLSELSVDLRGLRAERAEVERRRASLSARRDGAAPRLASLDDAPPANAAALDAAELADLSREIEQAERLGARLDRQIEARARTLPVFEATLDSDGLAAELRARRDHPLHVLLRRMYHEKRS
jgi:hypothetical protein